ncbi:MAG: divergent polysaccharide deacetylase family protein [Rhizobiaceae bacterium]|nr:divergent polysaccharide deacetylase family protein [Rhizobiaceae bacterium]
MGPENLERPRVAAVEDKPAATTAVPAEALEDGKEPDPAGKLVRARPHDGAHVERQVMDDGSVVTKFTPKNRTKDGPVVIDATAQNPQDPRTADLPDAALIEETPDGRLPVVAADGTRPVDRYARPWSGARGTRIAIVVGGLGLSQTGTQRALDMLPEDVTLAFAASGNSLFRWMPIARRGGHEILLQVPLEPFDYPANDPGRLTLVAGDSPTANLKRLHEAMGRMTNYTGIMNYLGGRFLADPKALEPVMKDISSRGLLFLDDGSSAQSLTASYAKAFAAPHAFADVILDQEVSKAAVLKKLDELERIAFRKGSAIGVASAFDESVDAVTQWVREAQGRGIEVVGVSVLADVPD